jgi:hypothetical protein
MRAALCAAAAFMVCAAPAAADTGSAPGGDRDINMDIGLPGGGTVLILCPGVGGGVNVLGAGGGWCDYGFSPGGAHVHCEWGAFVPVAGGWQCWRVWRGQPDHPRLPDPDVIPDGAPPRPDALRGPAPDDQSPPEDGGVLPPLAIGGTR